MPLFLAVSAAMLHGGAYALYIVQVLGGESVPNPASWTIWAFLASLNAATYYGASKSKLETAQFFTGSVGALAVWTIAVWSGKFSAVGSMEWFVLVTCVIACIVWYGTSQAILANLMLAGVMLASSLPTIEGVWNNPIIERAFPWWMWTGACMCTSVNVYRGRNDKMRQDHAPWQLRLITPVLLVLVHGIVAVLAGS